MGLLGALAALRARRLVLVFFAPALCPHPPQPNPTHKKTHPPPTPKKNPKNYRTLLQRVSTWLRPGGQLFVHVFAHRDAPYHFEVSGEDDWMANYFFSGGTMPSLDLFNYFQVVCVLVGVCGGWLLFVWGWRRVRDDALSPSLSTRPLFRSGRETFELIQLLQILFSPTTHPHPHNLHTHPPPFFL